MRIRTRIIACITIVGAAWGWLSLPLLALGQEEESPDTTFRDEPQAHALYDRMIETMRKAKTIYYESEYRWESKGQEMGHCTYKLWMKKRNYARLEATKDGELKGVLVCDGEYFWIHWPNGRPMWNWEDSTQHAKTSSNVYMKMLAPLGQHSIVDQIDKLGAGMGMTIIQPSVFHGGADPMDPHLDGVRSIGTEEVDGEECDVVEMSFMDHQRSRWLWLSKRDHLPRKLKQVIRAADNVVTYELWSRVTPNGQIPLERFSWEPPEGWKEWRFPRVKRGLLNPGAEAPDFDLTLADGRRTRLSNYRGKVVWLVFWRVGCAPCRQETPHLQQIYGEYKDRGLVVLGFNCGDDRQKVLDFLRENSVTFPNVVDWCEAAQRTFFEGYQTLKGRRGVPLNYIINREGRVADAWYGFRKDDKRGVQAIENLGVE